MVHLLIDIDLALHSALKHRAIDSKMTLKDLVIHLLEEGVRKDAARDREGIARDLRQFPQTGVRPVAMPDRARYGAFAGVGE